MRPPNFSGFSLRQVHENLTNNIIFLPEESWIAPKSMKILMVTPYYTPDLGPSAPLVAMLCEDWVKMGHQVTVLAAVPHFPSGHVPTEYRKRMWQKTTLNGVNVYRVWIPDGDRSKLSHRLLTFIIFQMLATFIGLGLPYDTLAISNPAIETGLPFFFLSWLRRKPTLLFVWDIYPDVGIHLGIFRNPAIIAFIKTTEDFCLLHSEAVHVLSESFVDVLVERGVEREKLIVLPPWLDTDFIQPLPHKNSFSVEFDLARFFVILYAGNLGMSQGLDQILLAAKALTAQTDILFTFVGDGANRQSLIDQVESMQLENVRFIPFQARERLPEVLASADIALVSLQSGLETDSLPSKTFPILASGRPIIAVVDQGSTTAKLVEAAQAGKCVPPAEPDSLVGAILFLKSTPEIRSSFGKNAREYALRNHSRFSIARQFDGVLERMRKKPV
jgi:colanic acid biosynthesis glycosyl transferase WcaI